MLDSSAGQQSWELGGHNLILRAKRLESKIQEPGRMSKVKEIQYTRAVAGMVKTEQRRTGQSDIHIESKCETHAIHDAHR